jgi:branched-chain amino acid transport system ATP-binding protein
MESINSLEVSDVSKSFMGLKALSNVSLRVEPGQIVGLIGPNGAGKTTLFNAISGFLKPDGGSVKFGGQSLLGLKPDKICKLGVARTFQIVKPFGELTVLQNVAVGAFNRTSDPVEAEDEAWRILEFVGLDNKALEPARSLTTPGRKRLELARALATRPKVLLLDEVMAGLNPTEKDEFTNLVKKIRDTGIAILIIEHAIKVIMGLCDRIVVIQFGCCIAEGDPESISNDPRVIEAYMGKEYASTEC